MYHSSGTAIISSRPHLNLTSLVDAGTDTDVTRSQPRVQRSCAANKVLADREPLGLNLSHVSSATIKLQDRDTQYQLTLVHIFAVLARIFLQTRPACLPTLLLGGILLLLLHGSS